MSASTSTDGPTSEVLRVLVITPGGRAHHGVAAVASQFSASLESQSHTRVSVIAKELNRDISEVESLSIRKVLLAAATILRVSGNLLARRPHVAVLMPSVGGPNTYFDFFVAALCRLGQVPVWLYLHGIGWQRVIERRGVIGKMTELIFNWAYGHIVLAASLSKECPATSSERRSYVLPNYPERGMEFTKSGANSGEILKLLFLSNLSRQKGVTDAVCAVAAALDADINCNLSIVGPAFRPRDAHAARSLARRLGIDDKIEFLGPLYGDDKFRAYRTHDALLAPSYREAMPMVLLEAQKCGLPCFAYDVGAVAELLESDSRSYVAAVGNWGESVPWMMELCNRRDSCADSNYQDPASREENIEADPYDVKVEGLVRLWREVHLPLKES